MSGEEATAETATGAPQPEGSGGTDAVDAGARLDQLHGGRGADRLHVRAGRGPPQRLERRQLHDDVADAPAEAHEDASGVARVHGGAAVGRSGCGVYPWSFRRSASAYWLSTFPVRTSCGVVCCW